MFWHGWNAYMNHAFPDDELRPLTCDGLERDLIDPSNSARNDVLGGYSLTLVDSLDMFAVLGDQVGFEKYVDKVRKYVSFNVSSTVQVFETTIRGMGGLLSAHLYASTPRLGMAIDGYDGHLLKLAYDLGERLLPSFENPSGIPAPRVNLRHGLANGMAKITPEGEPDVTETCTSGAGSLLLEFGLLSRLTGDPRFEKVARRAFFSIYSRRSDLDLVAMSIDSQTGQWQSPLTGNGASIDSYYEYALKYSILFGDSVFMQVFNRLYRALKSHSFDGWAFRNINYERATVMTRWIDSLASFFPSLMVLAGDIENSIKTHIFYYKIWDTFSALPERWSLLPRGNVSSGNSPVVLEWYPLRPEFIESNYYLYHATKDPMFLEIGRRVMSDLQRYNKVRCGYAGIQDVLSGKLTNRMESFFLSETVKYLYLLFDRDHPLNSEYSNFVFSTEAHPMWYDEDILEHAGHGRFEKLRYMSIQTSADLNTKAENTKTVSSGPSVLKRILQKFIQFIDHLLLLPEVEQYLEEVQNSQQPEPARKLSRSSSSGQRSSRLHGNSSLRYWYEEQCEVPLPWWHMQETSLLNNFYSNVGSRMDLYNLDCMYDFSRPVKNIHSGDEDGSRQPSLLGENFYKRYVNPHTTCLQVGGGGSKRKAASMDLIIAVPQDASRGLVLWRHEGGEIEATSLNGMRVKLVKSRTEINTTNGSNSTNTNTNASTNASTKTDWVLRVVDGIEIGENDILWVHELSSMNRNNEKFIEVMGDGQVFMRGSLVRNIKVIGK